MQTMNNDDLLDIPVAPCDYQNLASWLADSSEFADELSLVRHMLPAFHGPYQVKLAIFEGLMKGVSHLVVYFAAEALAL